MTDDQADQSPGPLGVAPPPSPVSRLRVVMSVAALIAMLAALGFVVRVAMIRRVAGDFANVSQAYLWMTPLGYLLFFGLAAFPVWLVARLLDEKKAVTWTVTSLGALALFDAFMPVTEFSRFAAIVLSVGAAAVVARRVVATPKVVARVAARAALLIGVPLAGAGLVVALTRESGDGSTAAAAPGMPNVLLLILDTVRADEMGTYGYARNTTPSLDRFAKHAMVFESAISTAPWTLPSHASMFTGRYPASLSTDYKVPLDGGDSTLAEVLGNRGYATAGFAGNLWYVSWESGLSRGFQTYQEYQHSLEQVVKSTHLGRTDMSDALFRAQSWRDVKAAIRQLGLQEVPRPQPAPNTAEFLTNAFLRWHTQRDSTRPYFAFINYFDAHDPFLPVEPYRTRFGPAQGGEATPRDRYDAELAYMDAHIGRLLAELERRGDMGNTLIIVAADHGEHFGERNQVGHFNSIYMPLLWVPLFIRFDGRLPAAQRLAGEVSLRDLPATIMDLIGARSTSPFPGVSLAGRWRADSSATSAAIASYNISRRETLKANDNGLLSLAQDGWHYILTGRKELEELYRYRADPTEARSLVGSDSGNTLGPLMRRRIFDVLGAERQTPPRDSTVR